MSTDGGVMLMNGLRLWCYLGIGVVVLSGMACQDRVKPGTAKVNREMVTGVRVAEVRQQELPEFYETRGTVRANAVSAVASKVMGVVTAIQVKEGDKVTAGQELLRIDDRDLLLRIKAAEAGYREALKALEASRQNRSLAGVTERRYRKLLEGKAISQQEMDQVSTQLKVAAADQERAQAAVARAEASVAEARVYLDYSRITAPAAGHVIEKRIDVGSMAVPGTPLVVVEDDSSYKIEVDVDERLNQKLNIGMSVQVAFDDIDLETTGQIRELIAAVDPAARTFRIKIGIPAERVRSGMYARVKIPLGERRAILLPQSAIVTRGQLTGVFKVLPDGVIVLSMIRTGKTYGAEVEILSGISAGDRIIVEGVAKAIDGGLLKES